MRSPAYLDTPFTRVVPLKEFGAFLRCPVTRSLSTECYSLRYAQPRRIGPLAGLTSFLSPSPLPAKFGLWAPGPSKVQSQPATKRDLPGVAICPNIGRRIVIVTWVPRALDPFPKTVFSSWVVF